MLGAIRAEPEGLSASEIVLPHVVVRSAGMAKRKTDDLPGRPQGLQTLETGPVEGYTITVMVYSLRLLWSRLPEQLTIVRL